MDLPDPTPERYPAREVDERGTCECGRAKTQRASPMVLAPRSVVTSPWGANRGHLSRGLPPRPGAVLDPRWVLGLQRLAGNASVSALLMPPVIRSEPHVQRKIIVGGKEYTPSPKYLTWLKATYSDAMVEFVNDMYNGGKSPDFSFSSYTEMGNEVRMRYHIIQGIGEVHKGCCSYPIGGGDGALDTAYWDKVGPFQFTMKSPLPAGKGPSDAIDAIFKSGAGTQLECNSTMVAIQYRAMLQTLGPATFNKKFPPEPAAIFRPTIDHRRAWPSIRSGIRSCTRKSPSPVRLTSCLGTGFTSRISTTTLQSILGDCGRASIRCISAVASSGALVSLR